MDQAVSRALGILEVLSSSGAPVRLSRLAVEAGLQKSTAHRILQTLIALGYAEQEEETGRYAASLKMWEMGSGVVMEHPVKRVASSFLQALHKETGETVSRSGDDVIYLDKLVSPRSVRFSTRPGSRVAAPLTAGGQAMLAHDPEARAVADRIALKLNGRRDFDADAFMIQLEATRARGYAISSANAGVVSFGCALLAKGGAATAALSISAPTERLNAEAEARIVEALLSTCARLAETVGFL
jgi:DNA-binding IclR family transcriptional regulator